MKRSYISTLILRLLDVLRFPNDNQAIETNTLGLVTYNNIINGQYVIYNVHLLIHVVLKVGAALNVIL